jgi:negative regulator of flagellin synthesis FlgM
MKIDEISKQTELVSHSAESASRTKAGGNENGRTKATDNQESATRIELSRESVEYRRIAEAAAAEQKGRIDRVSQLRDAVASGQYQIDSSRVAEKMISEGLMDTLKS